MTPSTFCSALAAALLLAPPAPPSGDQSAPPAAEPIELFPHVLYFAETREVGVRGTVAVDAHNPATPHVYLELIACTPDTREHESLIVTRAKPSHVHAALLAAGLRPGRPGRFDQAPEGARAVPATGDTLRLSLQPEGGDRVAPETWIADLTTGAAMPPNRWVFAGSKEFPKRTPPYAADGTGALVGLAVFGTEVVSPATGFHPDAAVDPPRWIARRESLPKAGTPVTLWLAPMPAAADGE